MGLKIEKWYFIYQYKNAIVSFWFNIPPTPAKNYQNDNFYTYNGIAIKGQRVMLTKSLSETSCEIFYYYKSNEYLL